MVGISIPVIVRLDWLLSGENRNSLDFWNWPETDSL